MTEPPQIREQPETQPHATAAAAEGRRGPKPPAPVYYPTPRPAQAVCFFLSRCADFENFPLAASSRGSSTT